MAERKIEEWITKGANNAARKLLPAFPSDSVPVATIRMIEDQIADAYAKEWKDVFDSPPMRTWVIGVVEHDGKRHTVPLFAIPKGAGFSWQSEFPVVMWRALPAPPATEGR